MASKKPKSNSAISASPSIIPSSGNPSSDNLNYLQGIFLACDGYQNTLLLDKNRLLSANYSLELQCDGEFVSVLDLHTEQLKPVLFGINQINDSGFTEKQTHWQAHSAVMEGFSRGIDFADSWGLENGHTAYLYQSEKHNDLIELVYNDPVVGEFIPVNADEYYQISGSFACHRCDGALLIEYYDNQHKKLSQKELAIITDKLGGKALSDYLSLSERIVIPQRAVFVRLSLKKHSTKEGQEKNNSFLFFTRLFFALSSSSESLAWSDCPLSVDTWQTLRATDLSNYCRLNFALPSSVYDGQTHELHLVERDTGLALLNSPKSFSYDEIILGQVRGLESSRVVGWVSLASAELELLIDERAVLTDTSQSTSSDEQFAFNLSVPTDYLDGRVHCIEVKVKPSGKSLGVLAEITPCQLTPWSVLQKYASRPLPAKLSPASAYRYEALRTNLRALSQQANSSHYATQLSLWHEILVTGFEKNRQFIPLDFPVVSNPCVSIVVPVHNKFAVTYHCLVALLFAYNRASFEVILVDDGSEDETLDIPALASGVTYLRNETAQGFIRSCNRGANQAKGQYIVMLNNDTEPTVHWLDELLFAFEQFDKVGLVGSKLLYPDGSLQEAGGIVWKSGNPWNYGRGGNPYDPRFTYTRQVDYLSGAAIMLPTRLWQQLNGFSEEYCPAYFEDTDLAFKVRDAGFKTVFAPLSVVYHFEGISSGTSVTSGIKRYQEVNRPKFKQKWIQACRFNGDEGKQVDLNKDRGINYRALVIDYQTPRTDTDAGSYAAVQEMRLLQSLGFKVTFLPENLAYMANHTEFLQRLGIESLYAPFVSSIQDFLEKRGLEFDVVYITRYYVARNQLPLVRRYAPQAKVLFCNADLHFLREIRDAIEYQDNQAMTKACEIRTQELSIMREVDVTLSYNTTEHAVILSHNLDNSKVVTCPWVVEVEKNIPRFAEREDIAFLGGFGHPPNKAAVLFFINQVMPLLERSLPEAKFRIYGSNVPADIEKLASDKVIIEGYVENVADVYHQCRVFVAPLLTGAGIKGKVIEALAHGTPSVLTPIAVEGTLLRSELEVLIAESPQEWADAVTRLYTDEAFWQQTSNAASRFAEQYYSFDNGRSLMLKALNAADIFATPDNQALIAKQTRASFH
ncbi:MAG: glycosyltransferase [Methylococcaceae bacterium]